MIHTSVTSWERSVRDEMDQILRSKAFTRAHRSQLLLRYIVERTMVEPEWPVKEYSIALEVFGRDASYDPSVDATVRVEAGRLRTRLREYYADEGRESPVLIEVPKGGYRAVIQPREAGEEVAVAKPVAEDAGFGARETAASRSTLRLRWIVLLAFLVGMLVGYAAALH